MTLPARLLLYLLLIPGAAYLVITPSIAERLLFIPSQVDPGDAPRLAGVQGVDLMLEAGDGVRVHAWWFEASPGAPAVLFLHGNAGTIGDRLPLAEGIVVEGVSVLMLEYRGYGRSDRVRPTEAGVLLDGEAGLRWLEGRGLGMDRIVLFGRSLGGAVSALLARGHPPAGLILESTFTSLDAIGGAVYPIPGFLLRRLRGHFDALSAVAEIQAPILVIHGTEDEIVPYSMGEALHQAAARRGEGAPSSLLPIPGARHNDVFWVAGGIYFRTIGEFVKRVTAEGGGIHPP